MGWSWGVSSGVAMNGLMTFSSARSGKPGVTRRRIGYSAHCPRLRRPGTVPWQQENKLTTYIGGAAVFCWIDPAQGDVVYAVERLLKAGRAKDAIHLIGHHLREVFAESVL